MEYDFTGKGIAFPFRLDQNGCLVMNSGEERICQSIMLILETCRGERNMRPDFGSDLSGLVFSPRDASTASIIKYEIQQALGRFEPRIELLDISTSMNPGGKSVIYVNIRYRTRASDTVNNIVYPYHLQKGEG